MGLTRWEEVDDEVDEEDDDDGVDDNAVVVCIHRKKVKMIATRLKDANGFVRRAFCKEEIRFKANIAV